MTIIYGYKEELNQILYIAEWSLAAAVMFGQTIIKLIHIQSRELTKGAFKPYKLGALIAITILIGLVPSLIFLALINITDKECIPTWVLVLQIILFALALFLFYLANVLQVELED